MSPTHVVVFQVIVNPKSPNLSYIVFENLQGSDHSNCPVPRIHSDPKSQMGTQRFVLMVKTYFVPAAYPLQKSSIITISLLLTYTYVELLFLCSLFGFNEYLHVGCAMRKEEFHLASCLLYPNLKLIIGCNSFPKSWSQVAMEELTCLICGRQRRLCT